jgi:hypothetical protein
MLQWMVSPIMWEDPRNFICYEETNKLQLEVLEVHSILKVFFLILS